MPHSSRRGSAPALRKEYIEDWRRGTIELLENTYIVTPDGKKHKLPKKGETPKA